MPAILRRTSGDRACTVAIGVYSPMERLGSLRNPVDRKALVSSAGLDPPPDQEQDRLITFIQPMADPPVIDEVLKITEPPKKFGTVTKTVYYSMAVRR